MTEILVGDWECSFQELLHLLQQCPNEICDQQKMFAAHFGTSSEFLSTLEVELKSLKINKYMLLVEILIDWRSRYPKTATLGALLEQIASLDDWKQVEVSIRELITKKAKSWNSLDSQSQSKILSSKVKFQGSEIQFDKLEKLLRDGFNYELKDHINQNVIQEVMQGKVLEMEDMRKGFLSEDNFEDFPSKLEIRYSADDILGRGSANTYVYKGTFGNTPVAVKVIHNYNCQREAENEIKILLECKGHPNVVIYHASTTKYNQYLLALELCHETTLSHWITDHSSLPVEIEGLEILRQTTDGLAFLHENQIIHRDLKPSNILFSLLNRHVFVKIADFGISRLLPPGKNSRTVTSFGGSHGWTAAEMLEARHRFRKTGSWNSTGAPKLTKKMDIFSLGCIFYQVLTTGKHPFGSDETLFDHNIFNGSTKTEENMECLKQRCNLSLITEMIAKDPEQRPDTNYIKAHPIFWSYQKMIGFIQQVSNIVERPACNVRERIDACVFKFEDSYFPKISSTSESPEQGWLIFIDNPSFLNHPVFKSQFDKNKTSAIKLVRQIRNWSNHYYEDRNSDLRNFVGDMPEGYMSYWLERFPTLINDMRDAFAELRGVVESMEQYYRIDTES